ncbi:cell division protein FtsK [Bacillus pseudomycoides]|uniref:DNA translocase FtsK n=1 Tax=Bacillus pseudomycoides TaxID=64104 RepID=A0AA91VFV9_9BACI|nr:MULTISPECIES: DNA translocase FtsK [Bacillus]PEB55129.1 cell division protein FtsK [Bacillus sp. AFS098217]PED84157.1 cell division protein FtsK [Bacillus pseudomycoides]PEU15683.1 cell division protein FtsK [Bacillus sp. AFS019443]PEU21187.1 cell division protein FtsK [Bacillus sp. AFS014408]PFW65016.1 cell division protein FtsK [Bacillus sp. AFS075034]
MAKQKQRGTKAKARRTIKPTLYYEIVGLTLFALSIITILQLGVVGKSFVLFFRFFFGEWYIIGVLGVIALSIAFVIKRGWPNLLNKRLIGVYLIVSAILMFSHITLFNLLTKDGAVENTSVIVSTKDLFFLEMKKSPNTVHLGGGMFGALMFATCYFLFDEVGAYIIGIILVVLGVLCITNKHIGEVLAPVGRILRSQFQVMQGDYKDWKSKRAAEQTEKKKTSRRTRSERLDTQEEIADPVEEIEIGPPIISNFTENYPVSEEQDKRSEEERPNDLITSPLVEEEIPSQPQEQPKKKRGEKIVESLEGETKAPPMQFSNVENKDYKLPSLDILKFPKNKQVTNENAEIYENARKLERTFQSFGVKAKVTKVHRGPAVTKYEVYPDMGVKVSKIVSLSDDLALALAAKDIRIEAPIPGKSAVGIEVPNSEVSMVTLREVLDSKANNHPEEKLLIGLGRDITGEAVLARLNKMPHLLVAGATGSGKSVCINGIIVSILMRAKPHEVKLMMIDPKMVELNVYNGVPHLLTPVVTDPKKASQALKKVVSEMERRYELFAHSGTRNIEGYNEYIRQHNDQSEAKQPELPYIVVIVDELADLMMVASSDVEDAIMRLAQMARAAGIHLIIATQRPSVDVITGVIKANIPSRIAFAVSSQTDSRTILDGGGAEKLLGRGDMLFIPIGASKPVRVQGAFLSDDEVERVVEYVIGQQKAQYQEDMIPQDVPETKQEVEDELYDEAVQLVVEMQTASVSMLQRRFRVGYTRAARLIDAMEMNGVVGPYEGSKPREVLIKDIQEKSS